MTHAPIALFAFNRPEHLQKTLTALAANEGSSESHLVVFCDGPRNHEELRLTDATRAVANKVQGFASVTVVGREKNMGCAASIIDGLQYMFAKHERIIVMEDDILTSPYTLSFLNQGLKLYEQDEKVFNIAAWSPPPTIFPIPSDYSHDVYAIPRFSCWGWASWRNRFENMDWEVSDYQNFKNDKKQRKAFDAGGNDMSDMLDLQMEGIINTWDIRADYARFKKNQLGINPVISYTTNIGMGLGTHNADFTDKFDNDINKSLPVQEIRWLDDVSINYVVLMSFHKVYDVTLWKKHLKCILKKLGLWNIAQIMRKRILN